MQELAVRIYWGMTDGILSHTPLVSVGALEDDYDPVGPTLVKDDQAWMLVNGNHCNIYASYVRAKTLKDEQPFQLLICLFIPVGQRLADEKSPLEVLDALGKKFDDWFGTSQELIYFNQSKANATMKRVLANYPLEECPFYVFQMEGMQPGAFRVESISQLSALMRYSNYYPIVQINCLEMSLNCKSTVDINTKGESSGETKKEKRRWWQREKRHQDDTPTPPKRQEKESNPAKDPTPVSQPKPAETTASPVAQNKGYQVWLNGEPQNIFLRWNEDEYYLHQESTDDLRYEGLHFKLADLKAAPKRKVATLSGRTVAQLDEKNNRINCEMKPVERWLLKEIAFTPDSDVEARKFVKYNPEKIQILIGREPLTDDRIKPSVAKKAVEKNNIRITPKEAEGYRFSVASAKIAKDRLVVTIEAKNGAQTQANAVPPPPMQQKKKSYEVIVNGRSQASLTNPHEVIQIQLPLEDDFYYEPFSFSLFELKRSPQGMISTPSGQTTIQLDEQKRQVVCQSKAIPHYLTEVTVSYKYAEDVGNAARVGHNEALHLALGNVKVTVNGNNPVTFAMPPSVVKRAIREKKVGLSASGVGDYSFRVIQSSYNEESRVLEVTIMVEKKKKGGILNWISSLLGNCCSCVAFVWLVC